MIILGTFLAQFFYNIFHHKQSLKVRKLEFSLIFFFLLLRTNFNNFVVKSYYYNSILVRTFNFFTFTVKRLKTRKNSIKKLIFLLNSK